MLTQDDLQLIRNMMREEIGVEAKRTRHDITTVGVHLESRMFRLENQLKDVEITTTKIENELKQAHEDIKVLNKKIETVDMKVETFNVKFDEKIAGLSHDMADGFQLVINTIDELNTGRDKRIKRLEDHVGVPQ
ncbi:MAG TPA: hypothetical protein VE090_00785 [Methylomirabilota bacterium]|nr:hypothetical protein [Methylomirabilota bacterium]